MTLIELLVAISILAIIAVMGALGLDSIVRTRAALNEEMDEFHGIQLAFAQLQNDCSRLADVDEVQSHRLVAVDDKRIVLLRRTGASDETNQFSIVLYRIVDGRLVRQELPATRDMASIDRSWQTALDKPPADGMVTLQNSVRAMEVRTWQPGGWQPGGDTRRAPPVALEVTLHTRSHGAGLVKVFLLGPA